MLDLERAIAYLRSELAEVNRAIQVAETIAAESDRTHAHRQNPETGQRQKKSVARPDVECFFWVQ
jgi:hypothetical protein